MQPPHGPIKIAANNQITLPARLLKQIDLAAGDYVYVAMAEELDDTLIVIPVEKMVGWIESGRKQSTLAEPLGDTDAL